MDKRRAALVIGANSPLGSAIALKLSEQGFDLVLHYHINVERVKETAKTIQGAGKNVSLVKADLTNEKDIDHLFAQLGDNTDRLNVLVYNSACLLQAPILLFRNEDLLKVVQVNQLAAYSVLQKTGRIMSRNKGGSIIMIGSLSQNLPLEGQVAYAMSKSAIGGLVRSAALELGKFAVTVNCIIPGPIDGHGMWVMSQEKRKEFMRNIPCQGIPSFADIAASVMFLCSENSRFITGQSIIIDGGLSLTSAVTFYNLTNA